MYTNTIQIYLKTQNIHVKVEYVLNIICAYLPTDELYFCQVFSLTLLCVLDLKCHTLYTSCIGVINVNINIKKIDIKEIHRSAEF